MEELEQNIKIAEYLVSETKTRLKEATRNSTGIPMTYKLQLRDDCKLVTGKIDKLKKGKVNPKTVGDLSNAVLRLKTTSEQILGWTFNPLDALKEDQD